MDKHVKAQFQETARTIVARDRNASKGGYSNNLPGDVTAALVAAYKLGLDHADNPPEPPKPMFFERALIWETIPPTSRNILSELTFSYSQRMRPPTFKASQLAPFEDERTGRQRWRKVDETGQGSPTGRSYAQKGIGPLLRLGLLEPDATQGGRLCLTAKGDATCREYWMRSDRNDPTLPIESMRG